MKKIFFLIFFSLTVLSVHSQLSINGNHLLLKKIHGKESIKVIVFDSIDSNTSINYTGTNVRFYKYSNIGTGNYSTSLFPPDDATGYIVEEDGVATDTIWVINYKNYLPVYVSLAAENTPTLQCEELKILIDAIIPPLSYSTPSDKLFSLVREFNLTHTTLEWTTSWNPIDIKTTLILPAVSVTVEAPLGNTYFKISGDQYAEQLNYKAKTFESPLLYEAVAVKNNLTSVVTTRDAKNEGERPTVATQVNGSAPLEVQFLSNSNLPEAKFYNWAIYKNGQMVIKRADKDHRYTFAETGVFKVKLTTTNRFCTDVDSITITVSDSKIEVPNVFTPNGDGFNDEFRVAFKSIVKFDCWVYNRSGRLMYHWTDPTKGWDGTFNGKKAIAGPYFYVIKAQGSDFDPNSEPDKVTKRRIGEFLLKGDINLLRGKSR